MMCVEFYALFDDINAFTVRIDKALILLNIYLIWVCFNNYTEIKNIKFDCFILFHEAKKDINLTD